MPTTLYDPPEIEYLDGRPHPKVSPKPAHAVVQIALGALIRACGRGRGITGSELRVRIDGVKTQFVPDIAFVSNEQLTQLHGRDVEEPPFSPDIAVEIRSPGDNLRYLRQKVQRYLATGSSLVLDVDPKTRTIHAHSVMGIRSYDVDSYFEHDGAPWLRFDVREAFIDLDDLPARS